MIEQNEVYTSEIEPYKENDITPAVSGVHIDRILVDVGSRVKAGQLLVTLDPTQYNQQRLQYQTALDDYNRLVPVYEAGGISAQQLGTDQGCARRAEGGARQPEKNIEMRSPIAGVVTARNYEAGNLFTGTPVLHVMQINPLKIIANIQEQYYPAVKLGMPVEIRTDIFPRRSVRGQGVADLSGARRFDADLHRRGDRSQREREAASGHVRPFDLQHGRQGGLMVPDGPRCHLGAFPRRPFLVKDRKARGRAAPTAPPRRVDILSGVADGEQIAVTALSRLPTASKWR